MGHTLVVGAKKFKVLSYPGGDIPAPSSLTLSVLTLEDGRLIVDQEAANLRPFKDYQTDVVHWFEDRGTTPRTVRLESAKMRQLQDSVESDDIIVDPGSGVDDLFESQEENEPADAAAPQQKQTEAPIAGDEPSAALSPRDEKEEPGLSAGSQEIDKSQSAQNENSDDVRAWSHMSGNPLEAESDIRDMVVLLSSGRLIVSDNHRRDPSVLFYINKVKTKFSRLERKVSVEYARMDDLTALRARYVTSGAPVEGGTKAIATMNDIIVAGMRANASDVHVRVERDKTVVKFRINGWLRLFKELTHEEGRRMCGATYSTLLQETSGESAFNARVFQDGQFNQNVLPPGLFNIREFNAPTVGGSPDTFTMVLRLQYGSGTVGDINFGKLGYLVDQVAQLRYMAGKKTGINLFSGPMGSGKSTSLQAMLRYLISKHPIESNRGFHVVTLEDPPEYVIPGASQIPITGGQFAPAIGRIMRFDVNTLMIGEIRDEDTAGKGVEVALTGHQVWSTIHANDALSIMRRLADLKVREELLYDSTVFTGLISQRLLPTLCPTCRIPLEKSDVGADVRRRIETAFSNITDLQKAVIRQASSQKSPTLFAIGPGCPECGNTGIKGRSVLAEIIVPDPKLMMMLRRGEFHEARLYCREEKGCASIADHAIGLLHAGAVDPRHVEETVGWIHDTRSETLTVNDIKSVVGDEAA